MVLSRRRRLGFWLLRRLEGVAMWIVRMSDEKDQDERIGCPRHDFMDDWECTCGPRPDARLR